MKPEALVEDVQMPGALRDQLLVAAVHAVRVLHQMIVRGEVEELANGLLDAVHGLDGVFAAGSLVSVKLLENAHLLYSLNI